MNVNVIIYVHIRGRRDTINLYYDFDCLCDFKIALVLIERTEFIDSKLDQFLFEYRLNL